MLKSEGPVKALTFTACGLCACVCVVQSVVNHTHHRKVGGASGSHSLWFLQT